MDRRDFLKATAMGIAGMALPSMSFAQQRKLSFGLSHDLLFRPTGGEGGPGVVSLDQLKTFKDHGIEAIRMMTYWNNIQPADAPLTADFTTAGLAHNDLQVELAHKAGIDLTLDFLWAPSWSTEDRYVLETWRCMDHTNIPSWNQNDPVCQNPLPMFPTQRFTDIVKFLLARYQGVVTSTEVWNEPQYNVFWPYRDAQGLHPDRKYLIEAVQKPFYDAVKSVSQDIKVVGPVETHQDYLRENLLAEKTYGRLFDIISIHEYGTPWWRPDERYPDCLFYRLDKWFKPVIDDLGEGRPLWITESGINAFDEPGSTVFKDYERLINDTTQRAYAAGHAGRRDEWLALLAQAKVYKEELSAIRAPKRLEMTDEFVGEFLRRQDDPSVLRPDRIYLHQIRSHPSYDPGCVEKDPDTYNLMYCDGTPTPVLSRMKSYLNPPRRRAVRR